MRRCWSDGASTCARRARRGSARTCRRPRRSSSRRSRPRATLVARRLRWRPRCSTWRSSTGERTGRRTRSRCCSARPTFSTRPPGRTTRWLDAANPASAWACPLPDGATPLACRCALRCRRPATCPYQRDDCIPAAHASSPVQVTVIALVDLAKTQLELGKAAPSSQHPETPQLAPQLPLTPNRCRSLPQPGLPPPPRSPRLPSPPLFPRRRPRGGLAEQLPAHVACRRSPPEGVAPSSQAASAADGFEDALERMHQASSPPPSPPPSRPLSLSLSLPRRMPWTGRWHVRDTSARPSPARRTATQRWCRCGLRCCSSRRATPARRRSRGLSRRLLTPAVRPPLGSSAAKDGPGGRGRGEAKAVRRSFGAGGAFPPVHQHGRRRGCGSRSACCRSSGGPSRRA